MSYARPAQPGGTAGRDPAGESTVPADVTRGRATRGAGATGAPGATSSAGRAGGTADRPPTRSTADTSLGTASPGASTHSAAARAAALRAAESGEPVTMDPDWQRIGTLSAGIVIGALIGAGAALLLAPRSGAETREFLARGAERLRSRAGDSWSELGDELRLVARRRRKALRRGITRGRWAVADLMDE